MYAYTNKLYFEYMQIAIIYVQEYFMFHVIVFVAYKNLCEFTYISNCVSKYILFEDFFVEKNINAQAFRLKFTQN